MLWSHLGWWDEVECHRWHTEHPSIIVWDSHSVAEVPTLRYAHPYQYAKDLEFDGNINNWVSKGNTCVTDSSLLNMAPISTNDSISKTHMLHHSKYMLVCTLNLTVTKIGKLFANKEMNIMVLSA